MEGIVWAATKTRHAGDDIDEEEDEQEKQIDPFPNVIVPFL
jgi:hypothetical protein